MGIISRLIASLKKTKESLSVKLAALFSNNKLGDDFFDELEEILISSDMSVGSAMEVVSRIRDEAIENKLKDKDYVIGLLKEALSDILENTQTHEIKTPAVIMVVGINGVGKTTTIGKLANFFVKQKKSVTIAAADTFRAAAADQLSIWADRAKVRIVKHEEGSDPSAVVFDAISSAKAKKTDILIIDTAGRLHVKANLMEELKKMNRVVSREYPDAFFYKYMVLDATTGQNALSQVKVFNEAIGIDGIVLTKLDGTAKGGFVISLASDLNVPVMYAGIGEKIDDIVEFSAKEFVEGIF
jgi:fused signal recognition particle receptor